jgi:hypothetical protein
MENKSKPFSVSFYLKPPRYFYFLKANHVIAFPVTVSLLLENFQNTTLEYFVIPEGTQQ